MKTSELAYAVGYQVAHDHIIACRPGKPQDTPPDITISALDSAEVCHIRNDELPEWLDGFRNGWAVAFEESKLAEVI